ncbi:unnamed protein product [Didymodactylos carnosus]|uniref:Tyrosinase C-terminal domain-containing protein n=2 Tax=Didymodactylos carnosus TaxID=1234261 RepID=A0A815QVY8_9BILA|nr:unnamed protein product [Didymodactylos carnosus]CAF4336964.1 unnamed protein product [Didymodactylos carnosus]
MDVRLIEDWKYTYPDISNAKDGDIAWTPSQMQFYIWRKFLPDNHYGIRWYLNILNLPKHSQNGPYRVRVFIDLRNADIQTPLTSPNYAGCVSSFARSPDSSCMTCQDVTHMCGSVELTRAMRRLGISVEKEIDGGQISAQNPPVNPFKTIEDRFKLVYVSAAGNEIKLDKKSTPKLTISWMAVIDGMTIADDGTFKAMQNRMVPKGPEPKIKIVGAPTESQVQN